MNIEFKTADDSKNLVGISCNNGKLTATFPIGYCLGKEEITVSDTESLNALKDLLFIIERFKNKEEGNIEANQTETKEDKSFPFGSYFEVIRYYADCGYYREKETVYRTDTRGKINWKRTISQKTALVQKNNSVCNPVYTDFVVRRNRPEENNILTEIHKFCVAFSLFRIGWYFGIDFGLKGKYSALYKIESFRDYAVSVLDNRLKNTNNDRLKRLFVSIKNVLKDCDFSENMFDNFTIGTNSFQNVWEKVIDYLFGIPEEIRKEYNPKITWKLSDDTEDTKENNKVNSLIIDTIMVDVEAKDNNVIYILDAKYYKKDSFPDSSSILKQVAYGDSVYYKLKIKNKPKIGGIEISDENLKNINNAFILPYDYSSEQDKIKYIKKVSVDCFPVNDNDNDNKHREIKAIYFDTKTLLDFVYKSETEKQNMKKELCEAIKN